MLESNMWVRFANLDALAFYYSSTALHGGMKAEPLLLPKLTGLHFRSRDCILLLLYLCKSGDGLPSEHRTRS